MSTASQILLFPPEIITGVGGDHPTHPQTQPPPPPRPKPKPKPKPANRVYHHTTNSYSKVSVMANNYVIRAGKMKKNPDGYE